MNAEQKQRATDLLAAWQATAYALHGDRMANLLQELMDAPEVLAATNPAQISSSAEPVLVVETEPGYWTRGHYCEGSKPYINPLEVWKLPVGTKLYTVPPVPSVPDVANTFKRRAEEIVATAMNRDNYAETNRLSAALILDIANAAEATTPAESPADVARDAERYRKIAIAAMCCTKITFTEGGPVYDAAGCVMDSFDPEAVVVAGSGQRYVADSIEAALLEMYRSEFEPDDAEKGQP